MTPPERAAPDAGRTFRGYIVVFDRPLFNEVAVHWSTLMPSAAGARARFADDNGRRLKAPSERVVKVELRVVEPDAEEVL